LGMAAAEGWAIWITGLPGSGKSTVARLLRQNLNERGVRSQILSSDAIRRTLMSNPNYSEDERDMIYRAIAFVAKMLTENSVNVIIDATGNRRRYRDNCRSQLSRYLEVYLRCPLNVCISREESRKETFLAPRDIYRKAKSGASHTVPGLGAPYEAPENPGIAVHSERQSPEEIVEVIVNKMEKNGMLNSSG
jgi:adenylylsulfate kinase